MAEVIRGSHDGRGLKVAVIASRFNEAVTDRLLAGTRRALEHCEVRAEDIRVISVPGAVEVPQAAAAEARSGAVDALVCLGAVIRGETDHYEHVSRMAADGFRRAVLGSGVAAGFGILTCRDTDQALARSRNDPSNKGYQAALAAVEMANLLRELGVHPRG